MTGSAKYKKADSAELVSLQRAAKVYGKSQVLFDIDLKVQTGECTALVGRNGSGKSTLLRMLAGLTRPTQGLRQTRTDRLVIGYVPERFPPLPFTPSEFLLSTADVKGMEKTSGEQEMMDLLGQLGLEGYLNVKMNQFSKGMLQKVNLIQALMGRPDLLLLDEPLSGLDVKAQESLLRILASLKLQGTAIVMSVHESTLIEQIADRVLLMRNGSIVKESGELSSAELNPTRIVARGLNEDAVKHMAEHPGIVNWTNRSGTCELEVLPGMTDLLLRLVLDNGGSVVSVLPAGSMELHIGEGIQDAVKERGCM